MAKFVLLKDPQGATGKEIEFSDLDITSYLAEHVPNLEIDSYDILLNDKKLNLPSVNKGEISDYGSSDLYRPLDKDDVVVIINNPKGETILIVAVVAAVATAAVILLATPKIPGNQGREVTSPNNTLTAQTNQVRPYQAIPDIYGSPISYPDLSGEATQEFTQSSKSGPNQVITQLMPVGVGVVDIDEVRTSSTELFNVGGSFTVYQPSNKNTVVPSVTESFSVNEVDGQILRDTSFSESISRSGSSIPIADRPALIMIRPSSTEIIIEFTSGSHNLGALMNSVGSPCTHINWTGLTVVGGITISEQRSFTATQSLPITLTAVRDNPNENTITAVFSISTDPNFPFSIRNYSVTDFSFTVTTNNIVGPFATPTSIQTEQLWIDLSQPRGSKASATFEIIYEGIDNDGGIVTRETFNATMPNANEFSAQFRTFKITIPQNFSPTGRVQVSIRRTNSESDDANTPSETRLKRVAAVRTFTNKSFGNVTMLEVRIPNTIQATSLRENRVNCDVTRRTIGYNRTTNTVDMTLRRSRSGADAILHEWVEVFGQDPELLDLEELYDIYDGLSNPRLGYFDYTFDSIDVSLGERLRTIANASRIYAFQDGSVWRFKRDELIANPSTILGRRDIASDANRSFSMTIKSSVGDSKDSVQVEYVDPETNKLAYIQRRINRQTSAIENGVGINPLKIEMPFCKEVFNATNRAELEIRKLFFLRTFVTDTFLSQGHLVEIGDKIIYERVFNSNVSGGEILAINGNEFTLSEPVNFSLGALFIQFTDGDGDLSSRYQIAAVAGDNRKITVTGSFGGDNPYVADLMNQRRGSVYVIGTVSTLDQSEYIVQTKRPSSDGRRVQLELAKADDRVYAFDT